MECHLLPVGTHKPKIHLHISQNGNAIRSLLRRTQSRNTSAHRSRRGTAFCSLFGRTATKSPPHQSRIELCFVIVSKHRSKKYVHPRFCCVNVVRRVFALLLAQQAPARAGPKPCHDVAPKPVLVSENVVATSREPNCGSWPRARECVNTKSM